MTIVLLLMISGRAFADSQFYFLAEPGVAGSASQAGQDTSVVYLRWDAVEGALPDDVESLELERNGSLVKTFPRDDWMSEASIDQMFQQPEQQQRLFQTLALLKEIKLSEGNDFEPSQFAAELLQRLQTDSYWRYLASRQNFNIARVHYRAFMDTDVTPLASYEYTLYAVKTGASDRVILGHATVNMAQAHQPLPVQNLTQLIENNCHSSQDHYTVALDWNAPGSTITDRMANNLQLAGYEIYRGTENLAASVTTAPARNLALEAASLSAGGRGEIQFSGLQRVNRGLLMLEGDGNPLNPEFFEGPDSLRVAGLKPGDRRAYYVVGRDFTDHYGDTEAVIVQVPNRLPPMTPWNIVTGVRQGSAAGINIAWDAVTLDNYKAKFPHRQLCNEAEAAVNGLLEYASINRTCARPAISRIDVSGYRLYRFDNRQQAKNFHDSDGDGVADRDEIAEAMECDANQQPAGAVSYRVALSGVNEITYGDQTRLSFLDAGSGLIEGEYYYYRMASATADGKFSLPSIAQRELYPDVTPPARPTARVVQTTTESCCKVVALNAAQTDWEFSDAIGLYGTLSLVNGASQSNPLAIDQFGLWSSDLCTANPGTINEFWGTGSGRQLIYPGQYADPKGGTSPPVYCKADIPDNMNLCQSGHWQLLETQCPVEKVVSDGDTLNGPVMVHVEAGDDDSCLEIYAEIAGHLTLVESSCGTDHPSTLDIENDGSLLCGQVVARDSSNNRSEVVQLPCLLTADPEPLSPPQVIALSASADQLDFSWRSPLQPTSATLIEITSDAGDDDTQLVSYPANNQDAQFIFSENRAIHTLLGARDQWCIRAMAVGIAPHDGPALRSPWSGKLCQVRRENGLNDTQYFPWPGIQPLPAGTPLMIERAADYVDAQQGEDPQNLPLLVSMGNFSNLFTGGESPCLGYVEVDDENPLRHPLLAREFNCRDTGRGILDAAVEWPFMMYRQARTPKGESGLWIQVSPLIETLYWERFYDKGHLAMVNFLDDPYFALYRHQYDSRRDALPWYFAFVDRYPYIAGYEYRYQMVTFSAQHAIKSWRLSDWISAPDAPNE
jgi:hypothetical protein